MNYDYWIEGNRYLFYSIGEQGEFLKSITFNKFHSTNLYEVLLEDYVEKIQIYSLNTTTNNRDVDKIYQTLISVIRNYSKRFPKRAILTRGTTKTVQRLDKIFIGKNIENIQKDFNVYTFSEDIKLCNLDYNTNINCDGYIFIKK